MHRAGHWLGMDVHDAGLYQVKGASQKLAPGMVLTVEPGTYIRPADNVPEAFWNIGVRIEDDVLVTADGHENLTAATPKTVADVEAACAADAPRGSRQRLIGHACTTSSSSAPDPSARRSRSRSPTRDLDVVVLDARARGRDAARRPLARAVARRAADPRAPRRLGARSRRSRAR